MLYLCSYLGSHLVVEEVCQGHHGHAVMAIDVERPGGDPGGGDTEILQGPLGSEEWEGGRSEGGHPGGGDTEIP